MKHLNYFLLLMATTIGGSSVCRAQQTDIVYDPYMREPLPSGAPQWMQAIVANPSGVNFAEMDARFANWMSEDVDARVKTIEKKPAVNFYRRWMKAYKPFVGADGNIHLPSYKAYADSLARLNAQTNVAFAKGLKTQPNGTTHQWRNIGPNTTMVSNNGTTKRKDSQACVFRIDVARKNPNTVYCGTQTGVVFKTTDKGLHWTACNGLHNFGGAIFALHVSPHDENTVFVGGGQNLWKTIDGGATWTQVEGINVRVNSIRISPQNPNLVTLSTGINDGNGGGFYVSTDGGAHFTETFSGICHDHELQPGNDRRIYLLAKGAVEQKFKLYVSENGGTTFSASTLPVGDITAGRLAVSEAPGGEQYVYALVNARPDTYDAGPYGGLGLPYILKSTDAGRTWMDNTSRSGRGQTFSDFIDNKQGGQGYFDMMIGTSAENAEHVIFGLCNAYRSEQGGKGGVWTSAIGGYERPDNLHPDMQDIAVCGTDTWICTDGGVKYSNDFFKTPGQDRNFGIYASEYHGFGQGWNEDIMAGGRWHNGDVVHYEKYGEGTTLHIGGVEQATGHILLSEPRKVYFSDNGVSTIPDQISGTVTTTYNVQFQSKKPHETLQTSRELGFDPRYAQRLIMSSHTDRYNLFVSEDEGRSFHQLHDLEGEDVASYEFARSNPDYIYVAGKFNIFFSTDNGKTWDWMENRPFEPVDNGGTSITIAVDPKDERTLWFANPNMPGQLAYTKDMGQTWHYPLNATMQQQRFNWIILTGNKNNGVYIGTEREAHVYYKDDTMSDWMDYSAGLPVAARIARLTPFYKEGKLRAATGQGIWEIPLYEADFVPVAQPMALNLGNGDLTKTPNKEVVFDSYSIVNQKNAQWEWSFSPQPQKVVGANERSVRVVFGKPGDYDVTLKVTTPEGSHSRTIRKMITIQAPSGIHNATTYPEATVRTVGERDNLSLLVETNKLAGAKTLTLHDLKGKLLHRFDLPAHQETATLPLSMLSAGVYIYELRTKGHRFYGKFTKP